MSRFLMALVITGSMFVASQSADADIFFGRRGGFFGRGVSISFGRGFSRFDRDLERELLLRDLARQRALDRALLRNRGFGSRNFGSFRSRRGCF